MIVNISKIEHLSRCDWRDERYGFCNTVAKYQVDGIACCGLHMIQVIKKLLDEAE